MTKIEVTTKFFIRIDAQQDDGSFERLFNDSINPNAVAKKYKNGTDYELFFFAKEDIEHGDEITYGCGEMDSLFPWRGVQTNNTDYKNYGSDSAVIDNIDDDVLVEKKDVATKVLIESSYDETIKKLLVSSHELLNISQASIIGVTLLCKKHTSKVFTF